jgi:hypothetical protein
MKRTLVALSLAVLAFSPSAAFALEIANIRSSYGPMGATRPDAKLLPGDVLFMTYDIVGLKFDDKTAKASYETKLEFLDGKGTQLFERKTPNAVSAQLGGNTMPGDLHVIMGRNLNPGKYTVRLTVKDNLGNESKAFTYPVELLPQGFGFVGVTAPAIGLPGQHYMASFAVVDMGLDAKKQPNVEVAIRVLDGAGKEVTRTVFMSLPKDIPEGIDVQKENFVPLNYPLYLNRAGRFTIEVTAADKTANRSIQLRYPLSVLDLATITGSGK